MYKSINGILKPGDKITCRKVGGENHEVLDVLKVYADGIALLCRTDGVRAFKPISIQTLIDYDYELLV